MNGTTEMQLLLCRNLELNEENGIQFLFLPDPCEFINVCFPDAVSPNILRMLSMHNYTEDRFPCSRAEEGTVLSVVDSFLHVAHLFVRYCTLNSSKLELVSASLLILAGMNITHLSWARTEHTSLCMTFIHSRWNLCAKCWK
jgi:hypothetical protein